MRDHFAINLRGAIWFGLALAGAGIAAAEVAPKVWRDLDQATLDAAYDQAVHAPNLQQVLARQAANSALVREHLGAPQRFTYGDGPHEALDVFATAIPGAPIFIFIHGGTWRFGVARDNAHPAEAFVRAGVNFVVPDFSSINDHGGDLPPLVAELRRAVSWVYQNAEERFDGDPHRIYVGGFSSGAHLAAVLLTTAWPAVADLPIDVIKGGVLCSGMYDLEPVALSARRLYANLTPGVVQALSPQNHLDHLHAPVIVAYGTFETPEFKRQAEEFAAAVKATGKPGTLLVAEGYNHFEMIETLANPFGVLGRAALGQIQNP